MDELNKAGPELDRWIFDNVMGGIPSSMQHPESYWDGFYNLGGHGHYSTNIAHAWEVMEKMQFRIEPWPWNRWGCAPNYDGDIDCIGGVACADTAPLAICLAAKKAVEQ